MGRHVAGDMPELDRLVDEACVGIGAEIDALRVPLLAGVVLGGGYGRGEGGIVTRTFTLSNDLDFFAITEDGAPEAKTVAEIAAALEPVSKKWTEKLGVDVDFAVKTPWRLKHDESRLMVQAEISLKRITIMFCASPSSPKILFADMRCNLSISQNNGVGTVCSCIKMI